MDDKVKKTISPEKSKNIRYQQDKDRELVKGMFKFYEVPGGNMRFSIKLYKGDEVQNYDMNDGEIYTIPLGVAKHLNKNGWYPQHIYALDENGKPAMKIGHKIRRCGFQSLDFLDIDEFEKPSPIITVEKITQPSSGV